MELNIDNTDIYKPKKIKEKILIESNRDYYLDNKPSNDIKEIELDVICEVRGLIVRVIDGVSQTPEKYNSLDKGDTTVEEITINNKNFDDQINNLFNMKLVHLKLLINLYNIYNFEGYIKIEYDATPILSYNFKCSENDILEYKPK